MSASLSIVFAGGRHSRDWKDGQRNGVKAAIDFIHAYAREMNDPSAKAALNACAASLGSAAKRHFQEQEHDHD